MAGSSNMRLWAAARLQPRDIEPHPTNDAGEPATSIRPPGRTVNPYCLTDLDRQRRGEFLFDVGLIGEAVQRACRARGLRRINYEVLGNSMQWLHGHVHARYDWEPADRVGWPVWSYPPEERFAEAVAYSDLAHGALRDTITHELTEIMSAAY